MASELYAAQVRLLMRVLPFLGLQTDLALKGGTAINLFVQDLPRLSVDIDLAVPRSGVPCTVNPSAVRWPRRVCSAA